MKATKFVKEYEVKSYETDSHGFLRLITLMNILQDAADGSATSLGLGFDDCAAKGVAWVGSNYLLKIKRLPKMHEKFVVETWPAEAKLWGAIRDFILRDENGIELVRASSQWVLIDVARKHPVSLSKHIPGYEALNERALDVEFGKAPEFTESENEYVFKVRFDDIDINHHVNNAVYPLWAGESVSKEWRENHIPQEIMLWYQKEALYGEQVKVLTHTDGMRTQHSITNEISGEELCRCEILWCSI